MAAEDYSAPSSNFYFKLLKSVCTAQHLFSIQQQTSDLEL